MTLSGEAHGRRYTIESLPANILEIDPGVQRTLNESRVRAIAAAFDESALGVVTVSARAAFRNGSTTETKTRYVVLDGQTRLAALRAFTGTDKTRMPVMCQVYHGLTRAEEAQVFLTLNNRAAVRPADKFRIALVAEEPWAVDLNAIVRRHGFEPDRGAASDRRFTAISTALKIMNLPDGPETLGKAFDLIIKAWGHRTNAASAEAVDGLGMLYHRHGAAVDTEGFAKRLARKETPQSFKGNVVAYRGAVGVSRTEAAYLHTLTVYNSGLRTQRLEARK